MMVIMVWKMQMKIMMESVENEKKEESYIRGFHGDEDSTAIDPQFTDNLLSLG